MRRFFRIYIVPGAVFQSVMVGGGYGTGREAVEYFTSYGAVGGFLGIGVAFVLLALVLATTFEYSRSFGTYDYRHFFKSLLGPGWIAFEILMIFIFLLVLAVLASAAGNILRDNFGISYVVGLLIMLTVVGTLTFFGQQLITRVLTFWSFFLYAVFIAFFILVFMHSGASTEAAFDDVQIVSGWWLSGARYAMYNVAIAPMLLYVTREFRTRGEAVRSGVVAGAIAMAPALVFQYTFLTAWPAVLDEAIPVYWMIGRLGLTVFVVVYTIMLFGTFIETGAGLLQGINERIDGYLLESHGNRLKPAYRAAIAVVAILLSAALSLLGITALIAKGYGAMSWGFLIVYIVPLLTYGIYQLSRKQSPDLTS
ncbi:MAG TPA: hypothetical protein PKK10_02580 [Woeseiaceae bacterium]|nr:hypothetical protein [Woeseiaceae bacterium]